MISAINPRMWGQMDIDVLDKITRWGIPAFKHLGASDEKIRGLERAIERVDVNETRWKPGPIQPVREAFTEVFRTVPPLGNPWVKDSQQRFPGVADAAEMALWNAKGCFFNVVRAIEGELLTGEKPKVSIGPKKVELSEDSTQSVFDMGRKLMDLAKLYEEAIMMTGLERLKT